ncbi:MAG: hypothetical protein LBJ02_01290 [Bifidobacteriaceae bacterium]|nr:hypothetical protein [Bifidobacteriaceae bacterium]
MPPSHPACPVPHGHPTPTTHHSLPAPPPDHGASLLEVVLSVVLLSIFTIATTLVVAQGTTTSANNRARITAAGLAQRELDLTAETITNSPTGANTLLNPQNTLNPHLTPQLNSGDPQWPFQIDGQKFAITRHTQPQSIGSGTPCQGATPNNIKRLATLVQVTITWQGMGTEKPHTASQLFPPNRNSDTGLNPNQALLGINITGTTGPTPQRPGTELQLTGPQTTTTAITDNKGCALFLLTPPTTGGTYELTITGHTSGQTYVNLASNPHETNTIADIMPNTTRTINITDYEPAATLTVTITNPTPTTTITAWPTSGGAGAATTIPINPNTNTATFNHLYPGIWNIWSGPTNTNAISITLQPGKHTTTELTTP